MTFDELYAERRAALVRLAYLVVGSHAVAEETVHEAFVEVLRRWDSIEAPVAYARITVVRAAVRTRRRRARELDLAVRTIERPADGPTGTDDELWQALGVLPGRQRAAVVLRFYEDCSHEEIGAALGCSAANARLLVHRGVARLKQEVTR